METKKIAEEKNEAVLLPGGITHAQLEAWKKEFGEVNKIEVNVQGSDNLVGYFKKPSREAHVNAVDLLSKGSRVDAGAAIMNDTWLGGNEKMLTDSDVSISVSIKVIDLINFYTTEIVKV
jgi:hypothetical protein